MLDPEPDLMYKRGKLLPFLAQLLPRWCWTSRPWPSRPDRPRRNIRPEGKRPQLALPERERFNNNRWQFLDTRNLNNYTILIEIHKMMREAFLKPGSGWEKRYPAPVEELDLSKQHKRYPEPTQELFLPSKKNISCTSPAANSTETTKKGSCTTNLYRKNIKDTLNQSRVNQKNVVRKMKAYWPWRGRRACRQAWHWSSRKSWWWCPETRRPGSSRTDGKQPGRIKSLFSRM